MIRRIYPWLMRAIGLYLLTFLLVYGYSLLRDTKELNLSNADVIVVLSSGLNDDASLNASSAARTNKGVELFRAGLAPRLLFTGGDSEVEGVLLAPQMSLTAIENGIPEAAIINEPAAQSTLQNALFSLRLLGPNQRLILVTDEFHLPRSWASFKLMGAQQIQLAGSHVFHDVGLHGHLQQIHRCGREVFAIWFNIARFGIWWAAGLLNIDDETRDSLLI